MNSPPGIVAFERADLERTKRRFQALNRERLLRVQESLKPRQRIFLELLPLLFHINHPLLPGFESKKTPAGVADYTPSLKNIESVQRLARSFVYRRRALRQLNIHSLFLMGSSGTIAYSEQSDFDIWVCHRDDLNDAQRVALTRKASAIGGWAATLGLEVHFFVMDADAFRRGEHGALSSDSSGGTQHHLLLEEFYRTSIVLAGRYPIWWLVPPGAEAHYDAYVADLCLRRFVRENDYLDFGGLTHVPAGEFFAAALWQLYKAIDSPYKSALKILLMEAYASEYPHVDLLCHRFKQAVYAGETDLDRLDPYVLMSTKVEEYLLGRGEVERLELARRCFYFKVGERLSAPQRGAPPSCRRQLMQALSERWGWDQTALLGLDSRAKWKIHRVIEERRVLVDELTRSYRMLSAFARNHAHDTPIDPRDLNLLGRKLYASFERKAGKIDTINPGISTDLVESHLSVHNLAEGEQEGWLLFRGEVNEAAAGSETPLKRARGLIELIAWCHFNGLIGANTVITLYAHDGGVTYTELRSLVETLQTLFPDARLPDSGMEALLRPPAVLSAALFVNLGIDPMSTLTRQGMQLTSNRTDALSYGGQWENLALTFDQILVNSWQEILTFRYSGEDALLECLCEYLAWAPISQAMNLPAIRTFSFSSVRSIGVARRVEELFQDVAHCFHARPWQRNARYVLRIAHNYYVLQPENDVPRHKKCDSLPALIRHLGAPQPEFSPICTDRYGLAATPLPAVFGANLPGVVQLFYVVAGRMADVYVIDERGSLFHQSVPFYSHDALLTPYQRFLDAVVRRRDALDKSGEPASATECWQVIDLAGTQKLERRIADSDHAARGYFDVQVIGHMDEAGRSVYTMYCDGQEFSWLEFADGVFQEVVRHVLGRRAGGERYPIYITDIDISRTETGIETAGALQTIHYLQFKKRVEDRLNEVLQSM